MLRFWFVLSAMFLSSATQAADSFYCPQKAGYINVGMNQEQVLQACGEPTAKKAGPNTVTQQIPVTQLIYTIMNAGPPDFYPGIDPIYRQWSLPSGSQGVNLQVDVVNNRVSSITLNQASTNGVSACAGGSFQIGDDVNTVINACGSPNMVNNTYINQEVPKEQNPEIWVYANLPYQSSITLTFVNGTLQSIQ